ncbi:MAG: DEAD/DEAH box helicase, partial [Chitinophagales bacterium]|nr:DEAD/DEAH box helicase [Chitinophagales bacterium]
MATYFEIVDQWYANKKWQEYDFQKHIAQAYHEGFNGLLNAPTGSGKTYAMFIPILAEALEKQNAYSTQNKKIPSSLKVLWISPLRALAKDIRNALQNACDQMELNWRVELRTGDVSSKTKQAQKKQMPEVL